LAQEKYLLSVQRSLVSPLSPFAVSETTFAFANSALLFLPVLLLSKS